MIVYHSIQGLDKSWTKARLCLKYVLILSNLKGGPQPRPTENLFEDNQWTKSQTLDNFLSTTWSAIWLNFQTCLVCPWPTHSPLMAHSWPTHCPLMAHSKPTYIPLMIYLMTLWKQTVQNPDLMAHPSLHGTWESNKMWFTRVAHSKYTAHPWPTSG